MKAHEESWEDIVRSTLSEEESDVYFNDGYGGEEGKPFTVWTRSRVYFPSCYDGSEDVASVSRNPDDVATRHVGGG